MMANMGSTIDYSNDFFIILDSMAMTVLPTKRSQVVKYLDGQGMRSAEMPTILNKHLLVYGDQLMPMPVLFVEFDEDSI